MGGLIQWLGGIFGSVFLGGRDEFEYQGTTTPSCTCWVDEYGVLKRCEGCVQKRT